MARLLATVASRKARGPLVSRVELNLASGGWLGIVVVAVIHDVFKRRECEQVEICCRLTADREQGRWWGVRGDRLPAFNGGLAAGGRSNRSTQPLTKVLHCSSESYVSSDGPRPTKSVNEPTAGHR